MRDIFDNMLDGIEEEEALPPHTYMDPVRRGTPRPGYLAGYVRDPGATPVVRKLPRPRRGPFLMTPIVRKPPRPPPGSREPYGRDPGRSRDSSPYEQLIRNADPDAMSIDSPEQADVIPEEDEPGEPAGAPAKRRGGVPRHGIKPLKRRIPQRLQRISRPNFSVKKLSAKSYQVHAIDVTPGVVAQLRSLLQRIPSNQVVINGRIFAKKNSIA